MHIGHIVQATIFLYTNRHSVSHVINSMSTSLSQHTFPGTNLRIVQLGSSGQLILFQFCLMWNWTHDKGVSSGWQSNNIFFKMTEINYKARTVRQKLLPLGQAYLKPFPCQFWKINTILHCMFLSVY